MDILRSKKVKTRKRHTCDACGRDFDAGVTMQSTVIVQDYIYTWRTCETCTELINTHRSEFEDSDGCFNQGCVREQLFDDITPEGLLIHLNSQS